MIGWRRMIVLSRLWAFEYSQWESEVRVPLIVMLYVTIQQKKNLRKLELRGRIICKC